MRETNHQVDLLLWSEPLEQLTGQLVAQDAGLAQAALQLLLLLVAAVGASPGRLEDIVDDVHYVPAHTALQAQHHAVILELHLRHTEWHWGVKGRISTPMLGWGAKCLYIRLLCLSSLLFRQCVLLCG